ncbi:MAG: hypothetical protein M0R46_14505 [Candidatus Muirbacterium halophilum]|nr:hypothetical protein [Candidatus Muirbacterium halophilum]
MTIKTRIPKPEMKFFENEVDNIILEMADEAKLDEKIEVIDQYMLNTEGKGKTSEEKDAIYAHAQDLWKEYKENLQEVQYNLYLNRPQYRFITDLFLSKLEYDVNTLFIAIDLHKLLSSMHGTKFNDDTQLVNFKITATELTYMYHLISTHKVKGLSKDAFVFSEILYRIANISRVIDYYEKTNKILATDIQNWVAAFEEGVEFNLSTKTEEEEDSSTQETTI